MKDPYDNLKRRVLPLLAYTLDKLKSEYDNNGLAAISIEDRNTIQDMLETLHVHYQAESVASEEARDLNSRAITLATRIDDETRAKTKAEYYELRSKQKPLSEEDRRRLDNLGDILRGNT